MVRKDISLKKFKNIIDGLYKRLVTVKYGLAEYHGIGNKAEMTEIQCMDIRCEYNNFRNSKGKNYNCTKENITMGV